jgi:hypothetical protein
LAGISEESSLRIRISQFLLQQKSCGERGGAGQDVDRAGDFEKIFTGWIMVKEGRGLR